MNDNDFVGFNTDFGFNRVMNSESSVLHFLNSVLPVKVLSIINTKRIISHALPTVPRENPAVDLLKKLSLHDMPKTEQEESGDLPKDLSIRYFFTCKTSNSSQINVEVQKTAEPYFYHHVVFFASRQTLTQASTDTYNGTYFY